MSTLDIRVVTALPEILNASTLYLLDNGVDGGLSVHMTGKGGVKIRSTMNAVEIKSLIKRYNTSMLRIVPTIFERDAATWDTSGFILVLDATSDPTVKSGAALYAYDVQAESFYKLSEYESMDLTWASIKDRPTSTVTEIDDAVSNAHSHENIAVLNGLAAVDTLTYKDKPVLTLLDCHW
jgi:hypothetical protein